jgi:predicted MFS family arabinose efflux permease
MTAETGTDHSGPWTLQIAGQLSVLAAAAFIYVTAEIVPVGALPAIARDLHVSVPTVGTLLAWYALVAALTTVPLVRWTARWPRRRTLLASLACLTASQLISALAPDFAMLAGARVLCAITHGLMLSVVAPIATRLVPASHSGRATTAIYVGISLAVVIGSPLTAAMSLLWGWRWAVVCVTAAAVVITVAARLVLPAMALSAEALRRVGPRASHHRNRRLLTVCLLTLIVVTGHYISYTFIVVIIRDVVGVRGPNLAWLLAAYGVAGLVAMPLVARPVDRRPKTTVITCTVGLSAAFIVLTTLAFGGQPTTSTAVIGACAFVLWGAAAYAVSPMLQAAAMRTAPDDPDGASGLYVALFQVGITVGSLAGGLLYDGSVPMMLAASAGLMGVALVGMTASRHMFDVRLVEQP